MARWGPYQFSRRGPALAEGGAKALLGRPGDSLADIHDKPHTTSVHSRECPAQKNGSLNGSVLLPDPDVLNAFDQVRSIDGQPLQSARPPSYPYFDILKDRLYRVTQDAQSKQDTTQLLVPKSRREMLFQAAHCNPMAGHLGQAATLNRLMTRFFGPGIHENVRWWCAACRECQLVNPPASPKAPLRPLPLMQVPFERIGMDLIGPLERSLSLKFWLSLDHRPCARVSTPSLSSSSRSTVALLGLSTPITAIRHRCSSFCTWPTYLPLSPESFSRCRLRWTTPPSPQCLYRVLALNNLSTSSQSKWKWEMLFWQLI